MPKDPRGRSTPNPNHTRGIPALPLARQSLEQAQAYEPHNDVDRKRRDENIAQIEAYITSRSSHPAGGGR